MTVGTQLKELVMAQTCAHETFDDLGSGGGLSYRQCRTCGDVLIAGGGRTWVVPRVS